MLARRPAAALRAISLLVLLGALLPAQEPTSLADLARQLGELQKARIADQARIARLESELVLARGAAEAAQAAVAEENLHLALDELLTTAVAHPLPSSAPSVTLGGYFDFEFRDDNAGDKNLEFDQHRMVLQLGAEVAKGIQFDLELEIEGGGADASNLTDAKIVIEFAELSFAIDERFNLKAGALLVPFNRYNTLHDSPLQDLSDRPLVARRVIPTTWTEAGVGAFGAFAFEDFVIDYDVVLVNGLTDAISGSGGLRSARGSYRADNNDDKMLLGRLGATVDLPWVDSFVLGFSGGHGAYDDAGHHDITLLGADLAVRKGPFELVAEWAQARLSRGADEIAAGIPRGLEGYYVEGRWHLFPECWKGEEGLFDSAATFTLVARFGEADTDIDQTAGDFGSRGDQYRDDRRRLTLGVNFRPVERTVVKFEYQWFLEPSGIPDVDNNRVVMSVATSF